MRVSVSVRFTMDLPDSEIDEIREDGASDQTQKLWERFKTPFGEGLGLEAVQLEVEEIYDPADVDVIGINFTDCK